MKKHYRIVSMPRFSAFIICCMMTMLLMINLISSFCNSDSVVSSRSVGKLQSGTIQQDMNYIVCPGDTLWSIVDQYYGSSVDKRQAVYAIRDLNGLTDTALYAGQMIQLPENI